MEHRFVFSSVAFIYVLVNPSFCFDIERRRKIENSPEKTKRSFVDVDGPQYKVGDWDNIFACFENISMRGCIEKDILISMVILLPIVEDNWERGPCGKIATDLCT